MGMGVKPIERFNRVARCQQDLSTMLLALKNHALGESNERIAGQKALKQTLPHRLRSLF
jgi:hypothetical protein